AGNPAEAGVDMRFAAREAADEIPALPHQPVRRMAGEDTEIGVERIGEEIRRLEGEAVADVVIPLDDAAVRFRLEGVSPPSLARALVLEVRVEVRRQLQRAVAAREQVVHARAVD